MDDIKPMLNEVKHCQIKQVSAFFSLSPRARDMNALAEGRYSNNAFSSAGYSIEPFAFLQEALRMLSQAKILIEHRVIVAVCYARMLTQDV